MKKPYEYSIHDTITNSWSYTNVEPLLHSLETWQPTEDPKIRKKVKTKEVYIDTRYKAKLRLYNYITYKKYGLEIPTYKPFEGTEIGKSIAILNF